MDHLLGHFLPSPLMTTVAIIGTAGRDKTEAARLTPALFTAMIAEALRTIRHTFGLNPAEVHLISGGAAWADHVAVELYL